MRQKMISILVGNGKSSVTKNFIWNLLGSLIYALSTILLTIITTRIVGEYHGGDFAIALGTAQIMAAIGYYEVRTIQVTDLHQEYQFPDYVYHRFFSTAMMMVVSIGFVWIKAYSFAKGMLVLLLCGWKMLDTFADVFEGLFQQKERLDISGCSMFTRTLLSTLSYMICLFFTGDMYISVVIAIVVSIICIILFNLMIYPEFDHARWKFSKARFINLCKACFPLFAGVFMFSYISNASRYAIDAKLGANEVTYFTAVFLPVSTINLVSGFIFKPFLTTFAAKWETDSPRQFAVMMAKFVLMIAVITLVTIIGGYLLGIPVLSFLYGLNLSPYRWDLVLLLLGGGFSAFATIEYYCLAVMRVQNYVFVGYFTAFILSLVIPNRFVTMMGLHGAALCYLLLMGCIVFAFSIGIYIGFRKKDGVSS